MYILFRLYYYEGLKCSGSLSRVLSAGRPVRKSYSTLVDTLYLKRCYTEALAYKLVNWVLNLYRRLHNVALLSLVRRSKGLRCEGIPRDLKQEESGTTRCKLGFTTCELQPLQRKRGDENFICIQQ